MVPTNLRARWTLMLGGGREQLLRLLRSLGSIDISFTIPRKPTIICYLGSGLADHS